MAWGSGDAAEGAGGAVHRLHLGVSGWPRPRPTLYMRCAWPGAGLKYKLACGSLVFKFESTFKEFYEPALEDGVHVVKLQEDVAKFDSETGWRGGGREACSALVGQAAQTAGVRGPQSPACMPLAAGGGEAGAERRSAKVVAESMLPSRVHDFLQCPIAWCASPPHPGCWE